MDEEKEALELDMFKWLDMLRESGATNMFGAGPYLALAFDISKDEARTVVVKWMRSFEKRHPENGLESKEEPILSHDPPLHSRWESK